MGNTAFVHNVRNEENIQECLLKISPLWDFIEIDTKE